MQKSRSLSTKIPFKITGYNVVNGVETTYNGSNEPVKRIVTKRPMCVLTTTQNVNIFESMIRKTYTDVEGVPHRCGGEVFELWRAVKRNGKTKEQLLNEFVNATKDANGEQRDLIASYHTITWVNPRNKEDGVVEKAVLSINFK